LAAVEVSMNQREKTLLPGMNCTTAFRNKLRDWKKKIKSTMLFLGFGDTTVV
jgi:hypothetical protein